MRFLFVFIFFTQLACTQSINIDEKIDISDKIKESSGMVYLEEDHEIITFNDSGGKSELYVLNAKTGKLKKTVKIKNAKNEDWESITQDDDHIYIGDTGNNNGNRKDLVIYKISKKKLVKKREVKVKKIHYTYQDQKSYTSNNHNTNFDCESITIYNNKLYLFTKNWQDYKTNIYQLPTTKGSYVAQKLHTIDINCMLTSIAYNPSNKTFIGTAYNRNYQSYLIKINDFNTANQKVKKILLYKELGLVNQTEAIAWKNNSTFYITREASEETLQGKKYKRNQKLIKISLRD